jgi:hypothetical protein
MKYVVQIVINAMPYYREPILLSNKLYDELDEELRKSFPNACVLYIERVVNPEVLTRYETFVGGNDVKEMRLFHGTSAKSIASICEYGYKKSYNKVSAYGHGTYFARAGSLSKNYTDITETGESFLFINRVAVGADTGGSDPLGIFVIKHDEAAYPEYLISFHRNAK